MPDQTVPYICLRLRKHVFQKILYLRGILGDINEPGTSCKHKHMLKNGAPSEISDGVHDIDGIGPFNKIYYSQFSQKLNSFNKVIHGFYFSHGSDRLNGPSVYKYENL